MDRDRPSATAQRVAMRRAAHQLLDHPPVLPDPLALRIIGEQARAELEAAPERFESGRVAPYLRAFLAVRSRLAEDELAFAVARGVRQYVILGAGLDTFAYRNPHTLAGLRVFEVDHPNTQARKRERLAASDIALPANLSFVPLEFGTSALADALATSGFGAGESAFVSLLGVSMYLTREALFSTLRFVASLPRDSGIVFDYATPRPEHDPIGSRVFDAMAGRVEQAGEPWISCFEPDDLARELRAAGFGEVLDLGQAEIHARYFEGRRDGLSVGRLARLACAMVVPPQGERAPGQ